MEFEKTIPWESIVAEELLGDEVIDIYRCRPYFLDGLPFVYFSFAVGSGLIFSCGRT
jgi:hypothetical protein